MTMSGCDKDTKRCERVVDWLKDVQTNEFVDYLKTEDPMRTHFKGNLIAFEVLEYMEVLIIMYECEDSAPIQDLLLRKLNYRKYEAIIQITKKDGSVTRLGVEDGKVYTLSSR